MGGCFDKAATVREDYRIRTMRSLIDRAMDQMTKRNRKEIYYTNLAWPVGEKISDGTLKSCIH